MKTTHTAAAYRSIVASFLAFAMFGAARLMGLTATISSAFPNIEHAGDLFMLAWCGMFLAYRLTAAWLPTWKHREEGSK